MIRAVIIDDEEASRVELSALLKSSSIAHIVGHGYDVDSGIEIIEKQHPDIVFLDIHLGARLGFEVLSGLSSSNEFSLIITTAYEGYTMEAFKHFAVNYLLKPVTQSDLIRTLSHIEKKQRSFSELKSKIDSLMSVKAKHAARIAIAHTGGLSVFDYKDIIRFEAEGAYTRIVLKKRSSFLASKNLGEIEEEIKDSDMFLRIHRSTIINLNEVERFADARLVLLSNGEIVHLSRRKKSDFLKRVRSLDQHNNQA